MKIFGMQIPTFYAWGMIAVILLAVVVSGYKLGEVPHGITWDEAAIGYNGYAIFTTRRDEWLTKLPVSFRSFGDYKAPLAIYLNGISTAIFGLNPVGIRLPFMIASVLSVLGMMLIVELLWRGEKNAYLFSLVAGFLMASTPWYVHYSRAGFESGLALFFTVWAVYFFLLFKKYLTALPIALCILFFSLSLYTYHSSKVVAPLLGVFLVLLFRKVLFNKPALVRLISATIGGAILLYFLLMDALVGEGLERAGVTLFSQYSFGEAVLLTFIQIGTHLHPNFLLQGATTTLRHGDGHWGVLLLPTLLLVLMSLLVVIPRFRKKFQLNNFVLALGWLLLGIVPAAMAVSVPHSNRALLALPGFILLAIVALDWLNQKAKSKLVLQISVGTVLLLQSIFFLTYIKDYFTVFAAQSATDFKDGYIEAFQIAHQYETGNNDKPEVEKIIFASDHGQPYIYALLVRKTNPIEYQHGSLRKYEFRDDINDEHLQTPNALIVALPDEITIGEPIYVVTGSDGQKKFEVFLTQSN